MPKIDLSNYEVQRKPILNWYKRNQHQKLSFIVSMWAATNQCPAIIGAFFLAEELGFPPEMIRIIDILIQTHRYDGIYGQSKNSPYLTLDPSHDIKD
jgi:hypothetical protein